jgi:formylglycine-generating enzyme required for sulfatase activity
MKIPLTISLRLAVLAGISLATPAFAVVSIDYASIGNAGNAGNANDAATGSLYGAVAYEYNISKNETTIAQYAEFLNAVAKTDSYSLYSSSMTTSYINGISRSGSSGSFTYSVAAGSGNKPITYVSWFDAARFCNWMQNGQQTGTGAALTAETGAYTLNGATSGIITKNVGATVWIPTESEWYKAAYYDPNKGGVGVGGYWAQATQSNTLAGNTIGVAGSANYWDGDYVGYPGAALTNVGAYGFNSDSAYGTNDQAGNVFEWNDAVISGSSRGLRGGSWGNGVNVLASSYRVGGGPSGEDGFLGFRVASVPEPSALVLTMLFSTALVTRRKR